MQKIKNTKEKERAEQNRAEQSRAESIEYLSESAILLPLNLSLANNFPMTTDKYVRKTNSRNSNP